MNQQKPQFIPNEKNSRKLFLLLFFYLHVLFVYSQSNQSFYTSIYNYSSVDNRYPMIGLVNHSEGKSYSLQTGLVNRAKKGIEGAQIGLVNQSLGDGKGNITGLVNQVMGDFQGFSLGLINQIHQNNEGASIGLVNQVLGNQEGFQLGLLNSIQGKSTGLKLALINHTSHHEGLLLALINTADSLDGTAIGLVNRIKHEGYMAFQVNLHENGTTEVQFKSGTESIYGILSYQNNILYQDKINAFGSGLGTRLKISEKLIFNPEILYHSRSSYKFTSENFNYKFSLYSNLIYSISDKWELSIGADANLLRIAERETDKQRAPRDWEYRGNKFWIGAHAGISYILF